MMDIRQLLAGLVRSMQSADFPDAGTIAKQLDMDVSAAKVAKTKRGLLTIHGAALGGAVVVDVVGSVTPQRTIYLLFTNSSIPYRDVDGEVFGADQRVQQSRHSEGFAILCEKDGLTCGLTASGPNGVVQSLFCEAPRLARAG
ncbi:hypothetical protein [Methylocapsa sp. S129]|uniref:hypothetical protein n=1 Tax=Methylocapsa sp. S129 TaxID=1641869 RepID=UPI00131DE486|nr:hypothetical protein [Methylocapsa sp. S129]